MAQEAARGSAKLWDRVFEAEPPTQADLSKAVTGARESYRILRWWKYGQPQIDRIKATLDVRTDLAGSVIQDILNAGGGNQRASVILDAFPYGLPKVEGVQVNVTFEREINR
ncbi:MAG TPA: hypothetical protein VE135_22035 [Pyrinomonadaceae bacterium]|jgi:hypothetical protein|nr:hypothetical protein [Pyrinomonadaceae bacterium]